MEISEMLREIRLNRRLAARGLERAQGTTARFNRARRAVKVVVGCTGSAPSPVFSPRKEANSSEQRILQRPWLY